MRGFIAAGAIALAFFIPAQALAQFQTPPGELVQTTDGLIVKVPITSQEMAARYRAATNSGPQAIGAPLAAAPAARDESGGVINVGQAFGTLAPDINSAVGGVIMGGLSWLFYLLQKRFNVNIDESHRDAIQTALLNAAASLIADGAVHLQGKTVTVPNADMANAANEVIAAAPAAFARFGLTPEVIKRKIIDKIPQVPAGAAMLAVANNNRPPPAAPSPVAQVTA